MIRKTAILFICIALLLPSFTIESSAAQPPAQNELRLIASGPQRVMVELFTDCYELQQASLAGYQTLTAEGGALTGEAGRPQMPRFSFLLSAPPDAEVVVKVLQAGSLEVLEAVNLAPAPVTSLGPDGALTGEPVYPMDEAFYRQGALYPDAPARVGEDSWLRNHRLVRIDLSPFQYNPAQKKLTWRPYLQVAVEFILAGDRPASQQAWPQAVDDHFNFSLPADVVLNADMAPLWESPSYPPNEGLVLHPAAEPASGTIYKTVVDHDGLYAISYDDLLSVGIDPAGIDPRNLSMSNQGRPVAVQVLGEEDGRFDPGDMILFYGEKFRGDYLAQRYVNENAHWLTYLAQQPDGTYKPWKPQVNATVLEQYTDENVYWLEVGAALGDRMEIVDGDPDGHPLSVAESYTETVRFEPYTVSWSGNTLGEDTWFGEWIRDSKVHTYSVDLSAVSTEPVSATIRGEFAGYNKTTARQTIVSVNGHVVDDAVWAGQSRYYFESLLPQSVLSEGENQVEVQVASDAMGAPSMFIDWFEISYRRRFVAAGGRLWFRAVEGEEGKYSLSGFSSPDVYVLEITDPLQPRWITATAQETSPLGTTVTFAGAQTGQERYLAAGRAAVEPVKGFSAYKPHLKSADLGADYLVITHRDFMTTTQELVDYRSAQGLRAMAIDVEDVYNEFTYGIVYPLAIKDFLSWTFAHWQPPAPAYAVLVGDGHYNPKGFMPASFGDEPVFMLPYMAWIDPTSGQLDAPNLLANVVGEDPLADVHLARIPVSSPEQLQHVIEKIIAYEQTPFQDWQKNLLVISDNRDEAGNFEAHANTLIAQTSNSGYDHIPIYISQICGPASSKQCPAARETITSTLNITGGLILNYLGHGSYQYWANERIFRVEDIPSLSNGDRLPVLLSLDCLDGYWFGPNGPSVKRGPGLVESLLVAEDSGIVAGFAPMGFGLVYGHDELRYGFHKSFFQQGNWEFGAATLSAKLQLYATGANQELLHTYLAFGDPSLRLLNGYGQPEVSAGATQASNYPDHIVHYTVTLTNTGHISDTFQADVSGNRWPVQVGVQSAPVLPGESVTLPVTVTVGSNALPGEQDTSSIRFRSGDTRKAVTVDFTTEALAHVYEAGVTTGATNMLVSPGQPVTYSLTITNTGTGPDAYQVYTAGNRWPAALIVDDTAGSQSTPHLLGTTGEIKPGEGREVLIRVDVPVNPSVARDHMEVTLVSASAPENRYRLTFTTSSWVNLYLPALQH